MTIEEAIQEIVRKLQLGCAQDIADGSGNSVSTVYNWRNNPVREPRAKTLERFLKYYNYRIEIHEA